MNRRKAWKTYSRWAAGGLLLALSGGCSFFYDLNSNQCERHSDCPALGPAFADTECRNRVCVLKSSNGGSGGTDGGMGNNGGGGNNGGTGNAGSGNGGMGGEPECTTNAECIEANNFVAAICKDSQCVPLITDECPLVIPRETEQWTALQALERHDPIILGAYSANITTTAPEDVLSAIVWDWALMEINEATLGGPRVFGQTRPVLALLCADTNFDATMNHLAVDIGVPGILSSLPPADLLAAFDTEASQEAQPLFMSYNAADSRLAALEDRGLVWHMLGSPGNMAAPIAALAARAERLVNERRAEYLATEAGATDDPEVDPVRMLLVRSNEVTVNDIGTVLASPLESAQDRPQNNLQVNGMFAHEAPAEVFDQVEIESVTVSDPPDVSALLEKVRELKPHIIVAMATAEFLRDSGGIAGIEAQWHALANPIAEGQQRPFYILSHRMVASSDALLNLVRTNRSYELEKRVVGVNFAPASDPTALALTQEFSKAMQAAYKDSSNYENFPASENIYDAAYYLTYAVLGAMEQGRDLTGARVANALEARLMARASPSGDNVVNVGPAAALTVINRLVGERTSTLRLRGTMGLPTFNFATGTRDTEVAAWCIEFDDTDMQFVRRDAVSRFDNEEYVFLSDFACIEGL